RLPPRPVEDAALLDDPNAEAREVVFTAAIEPGKLRGLAADQRAPRLHAPLRDALDHLLGFGQVQPAGGEVVEEHHRLGAADHDVVHAHRHQIDAHGVVLAGEEGELEARAHAVGSAPRDGGAVTVWG